ncbi:DUF4321 domain-containing protein [Clostridium sp.]|uniref:DUF4321 domain-containing protein n=1 Tax=Clostridium sp. TaxID=1506 RepID=UPI002FCB9BAC
MKSGDMKTKEYVFVVLLGAISGSFIGEILANNFTVLNFLGKAYSIGLRNPLLLDLKVIELAFGFGFNVNLMSIIGVILAIILFRKL